LKIVDVKTQMVSLPLISPYRIAPGTCRYATSVLVKIITDEGAEGVGETAVTVPERGGETQESIKISLEKYIVPQIIGMDPRDIGLVIKKIEDFHWGKTGFLCAKAGIDNALYDLVGKYYGLPVYQLLGGAHRKSFSLTRSLGVRTPEEMAEEAVQLKSLGYKMLTIKAGFDPQQDIERVAAVRDAVGQDFPLEVDVNGGYTIDVAIPTLRKMVKYGIENVEQPVPWWDLEGMAEVRRLVEISVTADESAWTPYDVIEIIRKRAADRICIKPIKSGGLYCSSRIADVAEAGGLRCVMGSKHPLGPGTAAILHFAAAKSCVDEVLGYGSPLERFTDDIAVNPVQIVDGIVTISDAPGLGVVLDEEKLKRYDGAPKE